MNSEEMSAYLLKLREDVDRASHRADEAITAISSHESICALRYDNINEKLKMLPTIFTKIDGMSGRLNLATGVWIGVLAVGGVLAIVLTIIKVGHGGTP